MLYDFYGELNVQLLRIGQDDIYSRLSIYVQWRYFVYILG